MTEHEAVAGYVVIGTDTGVGKTLVSTGLLVAASERGMRTVGLKPVATGCVSKTMVNGTALVNEDALALQSAASISMDYDRVNPVALEQPIAPHIAAARSGVVIQVDELVAHCRHVAANCSAQFMIIESVGGWSVPVNETETMADFCVEIGLPVILVVGMKLGCLNHALLTMQALRATGLAVAGWVANCTEPEMDAFADNLQSLRDLLSAPLLGVIPCLGESATAGRAAEFLHIDLLTGPGM